MNYSKEFTKFHGEVIEILGELKPAKDYLDQFCHSDIVRYTEMINNDARNVIDEILKQNYFKNDLEQGMDIDFDELKKFISQYFAKQHYILSEKVDCCYLGQEEGSEIINELEFKIEKLKEELVKNKKQKENPVLKLDEFSRNPYLSEF